MSLKKKDYIAAFFLIVLFFISLNWGLMSGYFKSAFNAVAPIVLGVCLAYPVNIIMEFYERHYFRKSDKKIVRITRQPVCLVLALLSIVAVIALIIALVIPKFIECVQSLVQKAPTVLDEILANKYVVEYVPEDIIEKIRNFNIKENIPQIKSFLEHGISKNGAGIMSSLSNTLSGILTAVIGLVFAVYILACKDMLRRHTVIVARKYVPERIRRCVHYYLKILDKCFHSFIVAQCTEAAILGTLCAIGMLIMGMPYAVMIGTFVALTALIPIVGGWMGALVGMVMVFTEKPKNALIFLIFFLILQQIEDKLIYPKVVGSSVGLPGIYVFAAVTVGGTLFGISGMLLSVPIAASVYIAVKEDISSGKNHILFFRKNKKTREHLD